jgi:hypothetical protein
MEEKEGYPFYTGREQSVVSKIEGDCCVGAK